MPPGPACLPGLEHQEPTVHRPHSLQKVPHVSRTHPRDACPPTLFRCGQVSHTTPLKETLCRVHHPARPPHRSPIHVAPEPEQMLIYKRTKKARRPCLSAGPTRRCPGFGSLRGMKRPPQSQTGKQAHGEPREGVSFTSAHPLLRGWRGRSLKGPGRQVPPSAAPWSPAVSWVWSRCQLLLMH